ncbi:PepSY-associated TM helix domain-containing protein [Rhodococcus sp. HNM0569]|uniref:PepSY domain-containing protein n=1 Tax=Rhodococcus sp. HNM0569 TaxID=2716340 RepID=UPI00146F41B2|nr:PepSY domain-containing protein [Rhodococcus sp. HNM0569]
MPVTENSAVVDGSPPRERPPVQAGSLRPLILRLHFYAGVLVAPFIVIATISGGLYALAPSIEQVVYREYLHVDATGPAVPVAEQIAAAQAARPDLTLDAVQPAGDPGETTRVLFTDPALGDSERRAVFVDPVHGRAIGDLTVYGSSNALPMRTWIGQLHRSLHLGEPGRLYSELAASWLWVVALGGLYLWIERYRTTKRTRRAHLLTVDRTRAGRDRTVSRHGALGAWLVAGLLFLSATGLTWSAHAGANVTALRSALNWTTPAVTATAAEHADHAGSETHRDTVAPDVTRVDDVLEVARAHGVDGKVEVTLPAAHGDAFVVQQTRQPWVMSNNAIAIDSGGTVTDTSWFADWPLAAKLSAWGVQAHMGTLFGLPNQLALAALAAALTAVVVCGYVMWWQRRGDRTVGRAPARGALRRIHPATAVVVLVLAAAVGWFVPLLGASLLLFLVVDLAVATVRRRTHGKQIS